MGLVVRGRHGRYQANQVHREDVRRADWPSRSASLFQKSPRSPRIAESLPAFSLSWLPPAHTVTTAQFVARQEDLFLRSSLQYHVVLRVASHPLPFHESVRGADVERIVATATQVPSTAGFRKRSDQ